MLVTRVVSVFPGCGKTYCKNHPGKLKILDSDSSQYHWEYAPGDLMKSSKHLSPFWPDNYIHHIQNSIGYYNYIFVSSHSEIRKALHDNEVGFTLVYPDRKLKNEWVERVAKRPDNGCDPGVLWSNWDDWIDQCEAETVKRICLKSDDQYLSDVLSLI